MNFQNVYIARIVCDVMQKVKNEAIEIGNKIFLESQNASYEFLKIQRHFVKVHHLSVLSNNTDQAYMSLLLNYMLKHPDTYSTTPNRTRMILLWILQVQQVEHFSVFS